MKCYARFHIFQKQWASINVYSLVSLKDKIYFTLDVPTLEEIEKNDFTALFDEYKDASQGLKDSIRDWKIRYDIYTDRWGRHRAIFLPTISPGGRGIS